MQNVPKERQICKYCYWCTCSETDNTGICEQDIHEMVRTDEPACPYFDYDDTFIRT